MSERIPCLKGNSWTTVLQSYQRGAQEFEEFPRDDGKAVSFAFADMSCDRVPDTISKYGILHARFAATLCSAPAACIPLFCADPSPCLQSITQLQKQQLISILVISVKSLMHACTRRDLVALQARVSNCMSVCLYVREVCLCASCIDSKLCLVCSEQQKRYEGVRSAVLMHSMFAYGRMLSVW
jgi:hypothetical protein